MQARPEGQRLPEDYALEHELLADEKERAEHLMLVDLGRNDMGRVSEFGTVRCDSFMEIERYSHVMHIVSNVSGKLREDKDFFDAFVSCMPAGTVSGAPKLRAMGIIAELENEARGAYAGAIGYLGFWGTWTTCITIRTLIFKNGKAYVQAGAGIVWDSVPENEYQETVNKAMAMLKAVRAAETVFAAKEKGRHIETWQMQTTLSHQRPLRTREERPEMNINPIMNENPVTPIAEITREEGMKNGLAKILEGSHL